MGGVLKKDPLPWWGVAGCVGGTEWGNGLNEESLTPSDSQLHWHATHHQRGNFPDRQITNPGTKAIAPPGMPGDKKNRFLRWRG